MRIGTRGSALARWQAREVSRRLEAATGHTCEIVIIRTAGDEPPNAPGTVSSPSTSGTRGTLGTVGTLSAKATFVKEIEDALLEGRVDLAVHSSKDLSAALPAGLRIGAVLPRDDPRDAVVLPGGAVVADLDALVRHLGAGPRIGTSSVRRAAAIAALIPRATVVPLRGNVDTRLRKLDAGACDAMLLAAAGLNRLGLSQRISLALPADLLVPAPGQGIVAIEIRADAAEVARAVEAIGDRDAETALMAERAVVKALGGGCQMPLGAHATLSDDVLVVTASVLSPDGRMIRAETRGDRSAAAALGEALAAELLARGAADILGARS